MISNEYILAFLLLGSIVGFMAGLLGIGGGGIMVPILTSLFLTMGMPIDMVVHLALGTSMAAIIFTSLSSLRAHHLRKSVMWDVVRNITPGIISGTFIATFIAAYASSLSLALFFSSFMAYVAVQMFRNKKPRIHVKATGSMHLFLVGSGIGAISALVSIGGGSLTVPYLVSRNFDIKKAIGTSAAVGLPLAISGTLGYLINGWSHTSVENYTFGFIYLPAVVLISITSVLSAPYGVKVAHYLPVSKLKKIFAVLLILLSLKMLLSVIK
jgi:uncharacterized membrane protein YfcA